LAVGVYRFGRDIGFAVGAVLLADACGMTTPSWSWPRSPRPAATTAACPVN
jgi:hypothetical protein